MQKKKIKRGDIYYAKLNPIIGSEQNGFRPVVVIQNDLANEYSPVVVVAPITSKVDSKPKLKSHVFIEKDGNITHDSIILIEQVRVLDKTRLGSYLCSLDKNKMLEIDTALIKQFQIDVESYIEKKEKKKTKNENIQNNYKKNKNK